MSWFSNAVTEMKRKTISIKGGVSSMVKQSRHGMGMGIQVQDEQLLPLYGNLVRVATCSVSVFGVGHRLRRHQSPPLKFRV